MKVGSSFQQQEHTFTLLRYIHNVNKCSHYRWNEYLHTNCFYHWHRFRWFTLIRTLSTVLFFFRSGNPTKNVSNHFYSKFYFAFAKKWIEFVVFLRTHINWLKYGISPCTKQKEKKYHHKLWHQRRMIHLTNKHIALI